MPRDYNAEVIDSYIETVRQLGSCRCSCNPRQTEAYRVLLDFAVDEMTASKGGGDWRFMPEDWHMTRLELMRNVTRALYSNHHHREFWKQAEFRADCRLQDADVAG